MEDIIAYAGSLILGIGVISTFIAGRKFKIIKNIVKTLSDLADAIGDGKLTKAESEKIIKDIKEIVSSFKK